MLHGSDLSRDVSNDTKKLSGATPTFAHPDDVLHSRVLSHADKRALLAAWASDAHVVPNLPAIRQTDSGAIVSIETVLAALRALDSRETAVVPFRGGRGKPKSRFALKPRWRRPPRGDDGDDDPPSSPAAALPPGVELRWCRRRDEAWRPAAA